MKNIIDSIMINWKIEKRNVVDLKNWEENPRTITGDAFEKLKQRIIERGMHDVLVIDTDNVILSGNQRKRALLELGIIDVDCLIPDRILTNEEKQKIALESNQSSGEWNFDLLSGFDENILKDLDFNFPSIDSDKTVADLELKHEYEISIICKDENEQKEFYDKLIAQGYICKILTL